MEPVVVSVPRLRQTESRFCTLEGNTLGAAPVLDWYIRVRKLAPHGEPRAELEKSYELLRQHQSGPFFSATPRCYR